METTIYRKVKASIIEKIFKSCNDEFNIRWFNAQIKDDELYLLGNKYMFKICIRHGEDTDAEKLFDAEVEKQSNKSKLIKTKRPKIYSIIDDEGIILKLYWKKTDAEEGLKEFKRNFPDNIFEVEECKVL